LIILYLRMEMNANMFSEVESRFNDGHSHDEIKSHFIQLGFNEESLEDVMKHYRLLRSRKQQRTGLNLLTVGALMCLASCILTFLHNYSDNYALFTLYGLTLVGACILLVGLALVFGL